MSYTKFKIRFNRLFSDYIAYQREDILANIYALGEELVRSSVPPEDIAEIFEESLMKFAQNSPHTTLLEVAQQISVPLVEMLVAYGISFRQHEETKLARQIIENTQDGIWMADKKGILQIVNPAFSHITGYNDAVGKELAFFFGSEIKNALESAEKTGYCRKEIIGIRKNGSVYPALLSISAIQDKKKQTSSYAGVINDISAQKHDESVKLEMERAKAVYELIIQPRLPVMNNIGINVECIPAENIGGDILEFSKIDENRLLIFIADVTGHGIPAAMTANTIKMLFKEIAETSADPAVICETLNKRMCRNILQDDIIAAFCGLIDINTMILRYSLHGIPPPMIYRKDKVIYLSPTGLPLGVFEDQISESRTEPLHKRDILLIFTDGITETKNETGDIFRKSGVEKSLSVIRDAPCSQAPVWKREAIVQNIIKDTASFQKKDKFSDDIIILSADIFHDSPAQSRFSLPNYFILKIKTRNIVIDRLVSEVIQDIASRTLLSPDKLGRLKIAFFEILLNAVEHGNLEMTELKKNPDLYDKDEYWKIFEERMKSDLYGERLICIEAFFKSDHLEISVKDDGKGFTSKDIPNHASKENITALSGRGIVIAGMNADKIIYNTKGNKAICQLGIRN